MNDKFFTASELAAIVVLTIGTVIVLQAGSVQPVW